VLAGGGSAFQDQDNPQVIFKDGEEGSQGIIEITDIVFSTAGPGNFDVFYCGYEVD
jgi:glucan 1,3-beta-glucosidase